MEVTVFALLCQKGRSITPCKVRAWQPDLATRTGLVLLEIIGLSEWVPDGAYEITLNHSPLTSIDLKDGHWRAELLPNGILGEKPPASDRLPNPLPRKEKEIE